MDKPLLSLTNITKSFAFGEQSVQVLHGIDLEIFAGEMVAIIGQSGSGKSTLMNIMACLDKPSSGDYQLDGISVLGMDSDTLASLRRDRFGFIFQRYQLLSSLTALDNVAMPAIYAGVNPPTRVQRAKQLLNKLGLQKRTDHYPNQLSGGQQQRVSIARALMNGGEIIFADEPTGALDSGSSRDVMEILTTLNREGHTVIIVTHDPKVASVANRVIEIADGRIVSDDMNCPSSASSGQMTLSNDVGGGLPQAGDDSHFPDKTSEVTHQDNKAQSNRLTQPLNHKKLSPLQLFSRFNESFRMAVLTMVANKMRTLLTMLGIIIGIASVVLIVALGNGSKQQILSQINSIGSATISISAGNENDEDKAWTNSLSFEDMMVLEKQPFVASVSPDLSSTMLAQVGNIEKSVQVEGAGISHHRLKNARLTAGAMFRQSDLEDFSQNIIISQKTKQTFFKQNNALGEIMLLNGTPVRVVGVFDYNGIEGNYDRSLKIWLPYRTYQTRFMGDSQELGSMTVLLKKGQSSALASENIRQILTQRHGKEDFTLFNSDSLAKTVAKTAQSLTLLIGAIGVISLLVGGIGVMNIMLVSVTERTGEIGVRMAVGATYGDIVGQFLIEAMVVCAIGGVLGVSLAFGLGAILKLFGVPVAFSLLSIILAVGCAGVIGLVFGLMPAHKGASLNPIEALNKG